jgi:hypothetical protein
VLAEILPDVDPEVETLVDVLPEALLEVDVLVDVDTDPAVESAGMVVLDCVASTLSFLTSFPTPGCVSALTVDAVATPAPNKPANVAVPATSQRFPDLYKRYRVLLLERKNSEKEFDLNFPIFIPRSLTEIM